MTTSLYKCDLFCWNLSNSCGDIFVLGLMWSGLGARIQLLTLILTELPRDPARTDFSFFGLTLIAAFFPGGIPRGISVRGRKAEGSSLLG